ncbi:MAG: hypothetical protein P4L45_00705 [Ignavibacteriaceae bacterium]|nr:hypothetical protein [Ignavibacteriaceae bacterium]
MRKLIFSINVSVDDIADHTVAVAADDELHDFYTDQLDSMDKRINLKLIDTKTFHSGVVALHYMCDKN